MSNDLPAIAIWFFAIWLAIQLNSCSEQEIQRGILGELREIKQEIRDDNAK